MEQVSSWASSILTVWAAAFWGVVGMALDNWLVTTIVILIISLGVAMQTLKEYLLYK